jgi:hypothetical protein
MKELRMSVTSGKQEEAAKRAGRSSSDYVKERLQKMDDRLEKIRTGMGSGVYRFPDEMKGGLEIVIMDVESVLESIRDARRGITGGGVEDAVTRMVNATSKKLDDALDRLKG